MSSHVSGGRVGEFLYSELPCLGDGGRARTDP